MYCHFAIRESPANAITHSTHRALELKSIMKGCAITYGALFIIMPIVTLNITTATKTKSPTLEIYSNESYGSDPEQIMDIYLPIRRNATISKIIVLIHGGGWYGGKKDHMNFWVIPLHVTFPHHAIVNIGYRLGTIQSPGFPKQIDDIKAVIQFFKSKADEYSINPKFALVGSSAGGHLSMLYGYAHDSAKDVRVVCNHIGPTSLIDPSCTNNRGLDFLWGALVGNFTYAQNPELYATVSPVTHVTANSPKTISFMGDKDPLIPVIQGELLEDKLDSVGVYNKYYLYSGGHGNWTRKDYENIFKRIKYFFNSYF